MSDLETWLIIILVIGVIASNLAVLKYSTKYKMPQFGKDHKVKPKSKLKDEANKAEKLSENNSDKDADLASSDKHNTDN
ncbi:conserved hypothetical protein [Shewanella sediminis HAW-EB3]|uniref:DUF2897 domain-containing protein n=1 Tax=Shewanella sediminis (strain HAW-EB3) TaxID=425104 RepID=A8FW11_SHESH|nr:DUF2897 family protein [Shewanella sediminis]ABV37034.1 conserved hypothetical protein [Shewanella sediminis HAW-EB3]